MATNRATSRVRTQKGKAENVPRRFWTKKEEECLIVCLEILYAEGIRLDRSLRNVYMVRLANMIEDMLPGCGIIDRHVFSKMSVWRRTHTAIVSILGASGGSGFSFDEDNHIIVPQRPDAWSEQEKVYSEGVKLVRGKSFPWLDKWNVLFGTDRATGNSAVDVGDAFEDLRGADTEDATSRGRGVKDSNIPHLNELHDLLDERADATSVTPPIPNESEPTTSGSKRRRASSIDAAQIRDLMKEFMATAQLSLTAPPPNVVAGCSSSVQQPINDIAAKQDGLYDALMSLPDLSREAVMWAAHHISNNHGDLRAFYSMPEDVRGTFVKSLMHFAKDH